MIVYVPIVDHGFAFLDTVTMRFVEVGGDQTFSDATDLREAGGDQRLVEMAKAAPEREPSAGWAAPDGRSIDRDEAFGWTLPIAPPPGGVGWSGSGRHRACVRDEEGSIVLRIQARDVLSIRWVTIWDDVMSGTVTDEANRLAAQFAAEDALLAIASVIVGAVRR